MTSVELLAYSTVKCRTRRQIKDGLMVQDIDGRGIWAWSGSVICETATFAYVIPGA